MKKFKKVIVSCLAIITLVTSIASISLADSDIIIFEEEIGINADNPNLSMHNNCIEKPLSVSRSSFDIIDGEKVKVSGGTLWAQWKGANHRAKYDHNSKMHRCTAANQVYYERSDWTRPGFQATSPWIRSSLTGNTVRASTK